MAEERIALLTGVSREEGLGYETAKQFIAVGFRVIITARDIDKVKPMADAIKASAMPLDVTSDESVAKLAAEIEKQFGKLDVLVNNAAAFFDTNQQPLDADMNYIKEAFDTNLLGAWRMIKALTPLLSKSSHPRIVNVSSGAGSFGDMKFGLYNHPAISPVYSLTKLALNGLTVKMAKQWKNTNIKINSVDPGFVATHAGTAEIGARPVAKGAEGIVWAATLPDDGPSGGFFKDGREISW